MRRRLVFASILGLAFIGLLMATAAAQEAPLVSQTRISGGNLPHSVLLTVVDEDAFVRRLDPPPILSEPPEPAGAAYTVTSPYWGAALRDAGELAATGALEASYFPEFGYARVQGTGGEFWLVINQRQQAILDRYIALTVAGLLADQPGILDVLVEASKVELITVQIGDRFLDESETAEFWQVAGGLSRLPSSQMPDQAVFAEDENRLWIIFNLPEGRAVQMRYSVAAGLLADSLGAEAYGVPGDWLVNVLGADAPKPGQPAKVGGQAIEQDTGPGSPLWWLVMGGGGLAAIGTAIWLRRRWAG